MEFHLSGSAVVQHLVGGETVFIQTARLFARFEHDRLMTMHGEAVRTSQTRRTGADHCNRLAGWLSPAEGLVTALE